MDAAVFATGLLNALAAAGAGGHAMLLARRADRTPLEARFMAVSAALALLAAVRALDGLAGLDLQRLEDLAAAFAPLGVLVLAEGALRRHAPRPVKLFALCGAAAFAVAAPIRPESAAGGFAILFALYLLAVGAAVGVLIAGRSREALAPAENRVINGLGLVLIVAAPLALTDFAAIAQDPPIRLGALAMLLVVYAAVRLAEPDADAAGLGRDAGLVLGFGACGGLAAGGLFPGAGVDDMVRAACLLSGGALATLVLWRAGPGRRTGEDVWLALAGAGLGQGRDAFLADALQMPALADVRLFAADALADHEPERLAELFADRLVLTDADLAAPSAGSAEDVLRALMETGSVTHAAAVSLSPLTLAVVNAGGLTDMGGWTARLAILARIARELPAGDAPWN